MSNNLIEDIIHGLYYILPNRIRYGKGYMSEYKKTYNELKKSEYYSREEIEKLQFEKLKKIVQYSYIKVPYYTQLFDNLSLDVMSHFNMDVFQKIPCLTKEIVRSNIDRLISLDFNKADLVAHATGGSTGEPCTFYYEKQLAEARENAFVQHLYDRIGYKDNDSKIYFRDFSVDRIDPENDIYWHKWPWTSSWWFSVRFLDETRIKYYIDKFFEIDPIWIVGYPSAIHIFCSFLNVYKKNRRLKNYKGVIFMSETVFPHQFNTIKSSFENISPNNESIMFSVYGHTEHGCIAGTCEKAFHYHIQPEYGYSEFDNGELITTGFTNYAMPLIRYRTQDLFTLSQDMCACGRHYQMIQSIDGRTDDRLIHSDGKYENANTLDFTRGRLAELIAKLQRYQFIQEKSGECIMRAIPKGVVSNDIIKEIEVEINRYFGNTLHVVVVLADTPILSKRGKERLIINRIKF